MIERVMGHGPNQGKIIRVLDHPFQQYRVQRLVLNDDHGSSLHSNKKG
jgi:hypothetical protein